MRKEIRLFIIIKQMQSELPSACFYVHFHIKKPSMEIVFVLGVGKVGESIKTKCNSVQWTQT